MMVDKINVDEKTDDKLTEKINVIDERLTVCPDKFLGKGMSANVYGGFYTDEFG
jgi:hypothetical protein